jgi:ankyrin repeat protein
MKRFVSSIIVLASFISLGSVFAQDFPPTAILNAAYKGDVEMVKLILATKPDPDIRDNFGATAVHEAIFESNLEVIQLLLDNGFDVNAQIPSNGYTPLHYAVWLNKPESVKLLLSYSADKSIKDKKGFTPLEKATKEGKRDLVIALSRNNQS